ncbi:MAG: hypothetical protein Q8O88_05845, partial [bacterium]|nr:hypothetical protein [bacterium]
MSEERRAKSEKSREKRNRLTTHDSRCTKWEVGFTSDENKESRIKKKGYGLKPYLFPKLQNATPFRVGVKSFLEFPVICNFTLHISRLTTQDSHPPSHFQLPISYFQKLQNATPFRVGVKSFLEFPVICNFTLHISR